MNVIKKSINTGLRKYNRFRVHAYNSREANAALEMIERQSGRLDIKYKKSADEYAMDVLGDRRYAPWIHAFSAIRRSFVEGWFPEYYYGFEVRPRTDGKYGNLAILKTLTNRILRVDSIPDSAYLISGNIYTNEFKPVAFKEARDIIFKDSEVVFFKENDSASGKGVERIERKNFRESDFQMRTDGCFQSMILQNDFFKAINASSTATLRITTVRDKAGMIGVRAAYLRVGRDNERFVRSDSGVRIPVDINTGVLGEVGFMNDWSYSTKHPDSGFLYSGKQIPCFGDAKQLCTALHEGFPHFELIGWDVCVDEDNKVKIMEWNANGAGILFHEAFTGPCFTGLGWENYWRQIRPNDTPLFL